MTTLTFKFSGTEAQAWQAIDSKATEQGYNPGYKFDHCAIWYSHVRKADIQEGFFYRYSADNQREKLHIICENTGSQYAKDKATRLLTINND